MKSFVICAFFIALIGGGLCARLPRDASSDSEESVPSVQSDSEENVPSVQSDSADSAKSADSVESDSVESDESAASDSAASDGDGLNIALAVLKAKPTPNMVAISKLEAIQAQNKAGKEAGASFAAPPAA